mmetsp:Transcript_9781/g.16244  ORF Transcript_9781/g.16244 Transcript_9781/m.16244 type:complete len:1252 (+) Transcript_9781:458-4213(+)
MMISTKDMGQDKSSRKLLKRSISKQRAGISLNSSETEFLLRKCSSSESPECRSDMEVCDAASHGTFQVKKDIPSNIQGSAMLPTTAQNDPNIVARRPSQKLFVESIKNREFVPSLDAHNISEDCSNSNSDTQLVTRDAYIPTETVIPIDTHGKVACSNSSQRCAIGSNVPSNYNMWLAPPPILNRDPVVQESRLQLPICGLEQEIIEAVSSNDVVVLCGETGSGKSTQVPQFLYENGFSSTGLIGITQPRRVAVTSTASRVAVEMGCPLDGCHIVDKQSNAQTSNLVGYQIRHDSSTLSSNIKIKFMTDGILLKEISTDILLKKYNVIILDEAHERNVNTDVLLGMLSRAIPLRKQQHNDEIQEWLKIPEAERVHYEDPIAPLRIIIMSATLRVNDFMTTTLFAAIPPVIKVESRQYSVKTHFTKRTNTKDYLEEAFNKVCQIHKKLPPGGILLFLTGKREILHMCRMLSKELNDKYQAPHISYEDDSDNEPSGIFGYDENEVVADKIIDYTEDPTPSLTSQKERTLYCDDVNIDSATVVDSGCQSHNSTRIQTRENSNCDSSLGDKIRSTLLNEAAGINQNAVPDPDNVQKRMLDDVIVRLSADEGGASVSGPQGATVLPLYALLASDRQKMVFQDPPFGNRLIVVATNVAETSITIPGIRYVVDCGRQKERILDVKSGISEYKVTWISQASANQRAGRAGRTGPGHCYRLYSSAYFHQHMIDFQEPEICNFPLEDLVLQLRSMGFQNVGKFPFPTPPPLVSLVRAETLLTNLGALKAHRESSESVGMKALEAINSIIESDTLSHKAGGGITSLGKRMAKFPIGSRLAKMLLVAHKSASVPMVLCICMIVCLSERSIFDKGSPPRNSIDSEKSGDEENSEVDAEDVTAGEDCLWSHSSSDILARVRGFGAFSYFMSDYRQSLDYEIGNTENAALSFCKSKGLHHPTLCRGVLLFKQLCQLCQVHLNLFPVGLSTDFEALPPPTTQQETALRQILLTGYGDSVARRVPTGSTLFTTECSKRKKLTAYLSCDAAIDSPLYIHPQSALYRKDPVAPLPEFVVYTELLMSDDGQTTYMSGVTQVSPNWIPELSKDCPLLQLSLPLKFPTPFYDANTDDVICFVSSTYGIHKWELPIQKCVMKSIYGSTNGDDVFRWFGRLLLEGKVLLHVSDVNKYFSEGGMLVSPQRLTDSTSCREVEDLIKTLRYHNICSLATLRSKISGNRNVVVPEILVFIEERVRRKFVHAWCKNCSLF